MFVLQWHLQDPWQLILSPWFQVLLKGWDGWTQGLADGKFVPPGKPPLCQDAAFSGPWQLMRSPRPWKPPLVSMLQKYTVSLDYPIALIDFKTLSYLLRINLSSRSNRTQLRKQIKNNNTSVGDCNVMSSSFNESILFLA